MRDIKIRHTGTKSIGSPLRHPMVGPYTNGDVSSVMPTIFQTMRADMVTWTVHNKMEETEGNTEAGAIESGVQFQRSGWGEGRLHRLPSRGFGYQTSDLGGASCGEAMEKALYIVCWCNGSNVITRQQYKAIRDCLRSLWLIHQLHLEHT